jgi:sulfite exporter TauE/SafE
MATFGLATIPALFFLGTATRFLQRGSLRGTMMKLAAMLVILYGLFTLYKAYRFIVNPQQIQQEIDEMKNSDGSMKCGIGKCV